MDTDGWHIQMDAMNTDGRMDRYGWTDTDGWIQMDGYGWMDTDGSLRWMDIDGWILMDGYG